MSSKQKLKEKSLPTIKLLNISQHLKPFVCVVGKPELLPLPSQQRAIMYSATDNPS